MTHGKALSPDDLEELAWQYGGVIERNLVTGELALEVIVKGVLVKFRSQMPKAVV